MSEQKFTSIGIFDKGDVITVSSPREAFLDCTYDLALIREIKGQSLGKLSCGLTVYHRNSVDCEICNITRLDTWKKIMENGLLEGWKWDVWEEENPLRWLLESQFAIEPQVFDYMLEQYPDTELKDILCKVKRYDAAVWAYNHGADPNYGELALPMKDILKSNRYSDSERIYAFLYNEENAG